MVNRLSYFALKVTVDGERDIPGLWAGAYGDGEGTESSWLVPTARAGAARRS